MGAGEAKAAVDNDVTAHDFVTLIQEAVREQNLDRFTELWTPFIEDPKLRKGNDPKQDYYQDMLADNIMDEIKKAYRSSQLSWRKQGILVARTFFHIPQARKKLINADFIGSVLLITLPEGHEGDGDEGQREQTLAEMQKQQEEQDELQLLAAETFRDMAGYPDFLDALCQTSVLNFLCIVVNQVPRAQEIVTATFVKLSDNEHNLIVLMEGAMGDILETFFKTVDFQKPHPDSDDNTVNQWRIGTNALANTAHALGMLIKYNHPCQVDMPTIIKVFQYSLAMGRKDDDPKIDLTGLNQVPDNVQLLAELSQLFYWKCRMTQNTTDLVRASAPRGLGLDDDSGLDFVLRVLVAMWKRCIALQTLLQQIEEGAGKKDQKIQTAYDGFCVDDLDRSIAFDLATDEGKEKLEEKKQYAEMRLCYLNCTLWVLLPMSNLRWKLRDYGLEQMHLAFRLREEAYLLVILGTVRYIVDFPLAQESHAFIRFFGEQLLRLLDECLDGNITQQKVLFVLLDAIAILAMGRDMQAMLADFKIYEKFEKLLEILPGDQAEKNKVELAILRTNAEVAVHPKHRLSWVCKEPWSGDRSLDEDGMRPWVHPPRNKFKSYLQDVFKAQDKTDNHKTIASLLLTIFQEDKFRRPANEIQSMFRSVIDWWLGNTTARFTDNGSVVADKMEDAIVNKPVIKLDELLRTAMMRQAANVRDSEKLSAPHECVIVLAMFSRLALEPRFKQLFVQHQVLDPLLGCICVGIWAEAREAAATIANLMWLPDVNEEALVCWLKFDGPKCIALDASNVLMPIRKGNPKPVDIGKGMYKSSWGIEFVDNSAVYLHPVGLKTHEVPGMLTTASPSDTLLEYSQIPYDWLSPNPLDQDGKSKAFSITCWFYWPPPKSDTITKRVLLSCSAPNPSEAGKPLVWLDTSAGEHNEKWFLLDRNMADREVSTPDLNPGWHMLSIICSTESNPDWGFNGTKFFLDYHDCTEDHPLDFCIPNDFYMVGNDSTMRKPFGLITDFRIYARVIKEQQIVDMAKSRDTAQHPDSLARQIARMDAATILAQRLDVPDSAAECLRALGSLASLSSERAKIFSVCGRRVLQMIDSPLPMIKRQAARVINNIT